MDGWTYSQNGRPANSKKSSGRKKKGRPKRKWKECVEEDITELGVREWRMKAQDRKEWRKIVGQAMGL
jgi:hypothetical protein